MVRKVLCSLSKQLDAKDDNIVVTVDIENAYNTRKRSQILAELFSHEQLRGLWRLAHWSYGSPTPLLLMENGQVVKTMSTQEGVRQGCAWRRPVCFVDAEYLRPICRWLSPGSCCNG